MNPNPAVHRIYLIGLMGAGKSTVGKLLAEVWGWQFIDLDQEIASLAGRSIYEIFKEQGEAAFRQLESQVLRQTTDREQAVIACGGGVVTRAENLILLTREVTVWLALSPTEAAARLEHSEHRPLLSGCKETFIRLNEILNARREAYAQAASLQIDSSGSSPELVTSAVIKAIEQLHG